MEEISITTQKDVTPIVIRNSFSASSPRILCLSEKYHINNKFEKEINATIQDDKGLIRDNYFDRVMNNVMCDFKNMLGFII